MVSISLLKDINLGPVGSRANKFEFTPFGEDRERVLFSAFTEDEGRELWVTDGTAGGTRLLKDINPGVLGSDPRDLTPFGDDGELVLFSASDGINGRELWVTDGTAGGTQLLEDIYPGAASSSPSEFTSFGDDNEQVLFGANDGISGAEPWILLADDL